KLVVVGRNPPDWLRDRIKNCPNVELHGSVPDVRPFIARAGVLAVPLGIGGGSRLKILEAAASGFPGVSTRVGAEGLELTPGRHLDVVEDCEGMAASLVAAIREPERMRKMAHEGRRTALVHYDWDALANRLEQVWLDTAGPIAERRAA